MGWMQFVAGIISSLFAFYLFVIELTNQVYHREVYKSYKWNEQDSPDEVFGTAGVGTSLFSKATLLRQAQEQQQLHRSGTTVSATSQDQTNNTNVQPHEPTVVTLRCVGTNNTNNTAKTVEPTKENYPNNTTTKAHSSTTGSSSTTTPNNNVFANHPKSKIS
jgi:hypothetical protein